MMNTHGPTVSFGSLYRVPREKYSEAVQSLEKSKEPVRLTYFSLPEINVPGSYYYATGEEKKNLEFLDTFQSNLFKFSHPLLEAPLNLDLTPLFQSLSLLRAQLFNRATPWESPKS